MPANAKCKFSKIFIHVGANDVRLCQSEITKNYIKEVCERASMMSDTNMLCRFLLTGAMRFIADCHHSMAGCLSGAHRTRFYRQLEDFLGQT